MKIEKRKMIQNKQSSQVCHRLNKMSHTPILSRRTVVSIPNGPSALAVKEAAWGLARYAAISQVSKALI